MMVRKGGFVATATNGDRVCASQAVYQARVLCVVRDPFQGCACALG